MMMGMHPGQLGQMGQMGQMGMMPYYPMMPMMGMDGQQTPPGGKPAPMYPVLDGQLPESYQSEDMLHIISKVLNNGDKKEEDKEWSEKKEEKESQREPDWSGFLLRNKLCKVGIDGFAKTPAFTFQDCLINITYLLRLSEVVLKGRKQVLLVEPTNEISKKAFDEYIAFLKKKESAGIAVSYKYLLFVLPKCAQADEICPEMAETELLVVMEDIPVFHDLRDKLEKCEDSP